MTGQLGYKVFFDFEKDEWTFQEYPDTIPEKHSEWEMWFDSRIEAEFECIDLNVNRASQTDLLVLPGMYTIVKCSDCGEPFMFTSDEAFWYSTRNLISPKRCKACRAIRKGMFNATNTVLQ